MPDDWDAYEHRPSPRQVVRGARQVGLRNAPITVQRCACGGEISVVRPTDEDDLTASVAAHQGTLEHQRWRNAQGFE